MLEPKTREALFETLVQTVAAPLQRYLLRRTAAESVEDVLAETLLVLWRRLEDIPGLADANSVEQSQALPWCYAVARGCLSNAHRAEHRRLRLVEKLADNAATTPDQTDHTELHRALGDLGELDRELIMLWAWEGLAPQGIAKATGLTPNAVSIRLHRAKKRLNSTLGRKNGVAAGQKQGKGRSEL